jgi:(3S)-malyl-CoA thioesterase
MLETAQGCLAAQAICAHPRLEGVVMGTNDLARDLGARVRADRLAMLPALGLCLLAARAAGRVIVDGVYNAFRDEAGLRAEAEQGRDLGFDGKSLIHPAQIDVVNRVFSPSPEEVADAEALIAAYEAGLASGAGVTTFRGKLVEIIHVVEAKRVLALAALV